LRRSLANKLPSIVLTGLQELCRDKPIKTFTFSADIYTPTRIAQVAIHSSSSSATSASTASAISSPTASASSTGAASIYSKIPVGAIAGIAIGGLVLIILILCAILLVLRRIKLKNKVIAKSKEAEGDLGNYRELSAPAGGYTDASSPGAPKYAHPIPLRGYGHESTPVELDEQRAAAELPVGPTNPSRAHSPFRDNY
jgi:hypothetical protein